jgi:hypothetical protein
MRSAEASQRRRVGPAGNRVQIALRSTASAAASTMAASRGERGIGYRTTTQSSPWGESIMRTIVLHLMTIA